MLSSLVMNERNQASATIAQEALITRRRLLQGAAAVVAAYTIGNRLRACNSDDTIQLAEVTPGFEAEAVRVFNPEVVIREPSVNPSEGCCSDASSGEDGFKITPENVVETVRREAPVFTLVHTVEAGDTVEAIVNRYYGASEASITTTTDGEELPLAAFLAANPIDDIDQIEIDRELYIPVADPVIVQKHGRALAEIAAEWGLSETSLAAVNSRRGSSAHHEGSELTEEFVVLPMQLLPEKDTNETEVFVVKPGGPATYYSIAEQTSGDLAAIVGSNKPEPTRLEFGHMLRIAKNQTKPAPPTVTTEPGREPEPPSDDKIDHGIEHPADKTPDALRQQRVWSGELERTHETDDLEQRITQAQLQEITISRNGYLDWVERIDQKLAGVFEEKGVADPDTKVTPKYFVVHHTAQGYNSDSSYAGVEHMVSSMSNRPTSIQWGIGRGGDTYQLVSDPLVRASHALDFNHEATGVEILTDSDRAQGSITNEQLTEALYLAYYVLTEVYEIEATSKNIDAVIRGHRELNDREKKGTLGKPDFFEETMNEFRARVKALANIM